jgi:hypothetical protein
MLTGYFKQPPLLASMNKIRICFFVSIISLHVAGNPYSNAYSILSHQALIDQSWEKSIKPLLKLKYPGSTEDELKVARAYAYGGAIAPDMGYFPFGSVFFTDLVHYVRSGDFVNALLDEADSLNEYAFAIGFLCHYNADQYGHHLAINRCVALTYPKMEKKYGDLVTYAENHISHRRIEFSFDVLQTARGKYATQAYHNFIGFQVSRPILERAFMRTYGLDLNTVFADLPLAIESFRLSVKNLFPLLTRAAWVNKRSEISKLNPALRSQDFRYHMRKTDYDHEFGKSGKKPGIFANLLALIIRVSPKIGPLRVFKFKEPGLAGEKLFVQSFDTALFHFTTTIKLLGSENVNLTNIDYDTGNLTRAGEYPLTDKNYGILILKLRNKNFVHLNEELKQNILDFYGNDTSLIIVYKNSRKKKQINEALDEIKLAKAN